MQKIILEITTVNDAIPEKVAETLEQMTGRKCRLVTPPSDEEIEVNAHMAAIAPDQEKVFIMGAKFTKDWML